MGYAHEIIGLQLKVVDSTNKNFVGLEGKVVNETKETITINTSDQKKICLIKKCLIKIIFSVDSKKVIELNGTDIIGRPWDRIKG